MFPTSPTVFGLCFDLGTVARRGIAGLYDLDSITDDDQPRLRNSSITIPTC
jgi:hypothetical protein